MVNQQMSNERETSNGRADQEFAKCIDRLYRVAMTVDKSPRSQIAYGAFLAAHGQPIDALRELGEVARADQCLTDRRVLTDVIQHVAAIENRLELNEPELWPACRPESAFDLMGSIRAHRPGDRRRRTGHLLLALARTSCDQGWGAVAVASLRKAIRCFETAARMKKFQHRC